MVIKPAMIAELAMIQIMRLPHPFCAWAAASAASASS